MVSKLRIIWKQTVESGDSNSRVETKRAGATAAAAPATDVLSAFAARMMAMNQPPRSRSKQQEGGDRDVEGSSGSNGGKLRVRFQITGNARI